jgi:single-stranded-DNA-specific exonuclease
MNVKSIFKPREKVTLESYLEKLGVEDIPEYLFPTGKYLEDPFSYTNMQEGVEVFEKHYKNATKTYILCDSSDTDGYCSTTAIYGYMKLINPDWDIEVLLHPDKTRGLQDPTMMERIKTEPRGFLIVPDSGSNDREQVKELKNNYGIDVIVLDHHDIDNPIEDGVLISNQLGDVDPTGSGGVVTHIFMRALDLHLGLTYSREFIDLTSLSIISDGMDVRSLQNRTYLHFGILNYAPNNEFLSALIEKFVRSEDFTQKDLSFKVIPKINSVGRSSGYEDKLKMIEGLTKGGDIEDTVSMCGDSHKNQIDNVASFIDEYIDEINSDGQVIIFGNEEVNRMYSGLLAGKIKDKVEGKPTIIGKVEDGLFTGSLRADCPLKETIQNSGLVEWCSGHPGQAGVCVKVENIPALQEYLNTRELPEPEKITVVKSLSAKGINKSYFTMFLGNDELWNSNTLPKPIFHITNVSINSKDISIIGKNKRTLKFNLHGVDYIIFNSLKKDKEDLGLGYYNEKDKFVEENKEETLHLEILGNLDINVWNDKTYNQVIVEAYEIISIGKKPEQSIDDIF